MEKGFRKYIPIIGGFIFILGAKMGMDFQKNILDENHKTQQTSLDSLKHISPLKDVEFTGEDMDGKPGQECTFIYNGRNYEFVDIGGKPVNLEYVVEDSGKVRYILE